MLEVNARMQASLSVPIECWTHFLAVFLSVCFGYVFVPSLAQPAVKASSLLFEDGEIREGRLLPHHLTSPAFGSFRTIVPGQLASLPIGPLTELLVRVISRNVPYPSPP